jgi:hypothetical protein
MIYVLFCFRFIINDLRKYQNDDKNNNDNTETEKKETTT